MTEKLWEYGGAYHQLNMEGVIDLPLGSKVEVCDWIVRMPDFMKEADTLFIDGPWNIGNVNTFYTKADLPHLKGFDFEGFSRVLFGRIDEIKPKFLFLEIGKEYLHWYLTECKKRYKYVTFYNSTYYHKRTNKCYVIHATDDFKHRRYPELEDLDESDIISWLTENHSYECIGDLCMGKGQVGLKANANGKRFVGTELNKKRLAILVAALLPSSQP